MVRLDIQQAAERFGVSEQTIRRRLHNGLLEGYQEGPPHGRWWVELPQEDESNHQRDQVDAQVVIAMLQQQLEIKDRQLESKDLQIEQLHVLLQQAQKALPAPKEDRSPWWRRLWQHN